MEPVFFFNDINVETNDSVECETVTHSTKTVEKYNSCEPILANCFGFVACAFTLTCIVVSEPLLSTPSQKIYHTLSQCQTADNVSS